MKKIKKLTSVVICALLVIFSTVYAFAAELSVNGASVQVGETVTYTLNLANVPSPVAGVQLSIYYDSELLQADAASVSYEGFPGALVNTDIPGEIVMNAANGVDGYDFKTKTEMISVTFMAIKEGSTDITYYIDELFDIYEYGPGDYLKTYTLTSDISVNGNSTVTDKPPVLNPDRQENDDRGDFVNNDSGIGEVSPEDATVPPTDDNTDNSNASENEQSSDDKDNQEDPDNNSSTSAVGDADKSGVTSSASPMPWIIGGIIVVVIAAAIIAVVAVNKKKAKAAADTNQIQTKPDTDNNDKKD